MSMGERWGVLVSACVLATTLTVSAPAEAAASDQPVDFHIQAQGLAGALDALSEQSGVPVLYPYDQVASLRAPAVNGRMAPREALQRLIGRTALKVSFAQDGVIAMSAKAPRRAELIRTSEAVATADPTPLAAASAPAAPVAAPPTPNPDQPTASGGNPIAEVVVTGVRGRPRTVVNSPTPIDVLTSSELEDTGTTGILQSLETLVPSFNLPARAGGGTATVIATGGLRGLNPDQTLILVDGKRRHKTALLNAVSSLYIGSDPVDLNLIPESGISRIEVLRDGAAAQYGSDAIAGVINVILRKDNGGYVSATAGQNFDHGDGQFLNTEAEYGAKVADKGHINVFFNSKDQATSNRALPIASTVQLFPKVNGQPNPLEATANRLVTKNYGQLPSINLNAGYNATYDVSSKLQLYSFSSYSYRDSDLPYTFRSATSPYSLPAIYPDGFRPNLNIFENDFQTTDGASGDLDGWSVDLSTSYGESRAREDLGQSINASLGVTSPTAFYVGTLLSSEWDNSLDVTRDFHFSDVSDVQLSFGLQHRRESFQLKAGDPTSYESGPFASSSIAPGAQAVPGIQPSDSSNHARNDFAAYAEAGYTPFKRLFLDGAVRYENYSDSSGDSVVGKFDGRYQLTDWVAVRGAVSNGFRAPSLAQEYYSSTSSQFQLVNNTLTLLSIKTLPVDSPQAKALGAQPLRPETSRNYSAGLTFNPLRNFSTTLDFYRIDVDKRIALTSTLTGTAVSNILVANGLSGALSAQYFSNAIDTRTQGVDLVSTHHQPLGGYGLLGLSFGFNYNETDITHIAANPPQLTALGSSFVLFDRLSQGYLTAAFPKTKISLDTDYTFGPLHIIYRETRYGGFRILQDTPSSDRSFGQKWITDLEVDYNLTKRVVIAAGSNNIGNVHPSANGIYNATIGSGQYPTTSPFGFTGGFYYARIRVAL